MLLPTATWAPPKGARACCRWRAHWGRADAARPAPAGPPERVRQDRTRWSRPGRATPTAANQLDRAAWLLTRHADLWLGLSHDTQLLLCEQPAPHGPYFAAIERLLHDHGPLAMTALLQDLAADAESDTLRPLLERVQRFHEIDADPPASMLEAVLRNLELDVVNEALKELTAAGDLSDAAAARLRALYARQAELKRAAAPAVG